MADIGLDMSEGEEEEQVIFPRRRRRLRRLASLERERALEEPLDIQEAEVDEELLRALQRFSQRFPQIEYSCLDEFGVTPSHRQQLQEQRQQLQEQVQQLEFMFESELNQIHDDNNDDEVQVQQSQMTVSPPAAANVLYTVLNDPEVFNCTICYNPLFTPLFQCANGHILCSSCCSKSEGNCPYCRMRIDGRCCGLEKFLRSIDISCIYAHNGCPETMPYSKKIEHEQVCQHGPCFCPYPSCPYADSPWLLYDHFDVQHPLSATRFTYNTTFSVSVEINQKQIFLQESRGRVVFILHHEVQQNGGRAFYVDCVGLESILKNMFAYRLAAESRDMDTSLTFKSLPDVHTQLPKHTLMKSYLTVPSAFAGDNGIMSLSVCIIKADPAALEAQEGERGLHDRDAHKVLKVVLNDPATLNCSICLEPLWTPVFQCKNSHLACSSCCSKLESKCSCCGYNYNRFRGLEKVIESIDKISCKYAKYGCKVTMPYNEKTEHEKDCPCASLNTES